MQASLRLFGIMHQSASTALLIAMSVVTKTVDSAVELVVIIYLVALQNVVMVQLLTVVLFVKQLLTQDVLYQVNLAFVLKILPKVEKLVQIDLAHKWNFSQTFFEKFKT